ncbi:hypothetical protein ACTFIZ_007529 [Dictyostelium cf. discoideum]
MDVLVSFDFTFSEVEHSQQSNQTQQPVTTVVLAAIQTQDVPVILPVNGTVTAFSNVDIHPQVASTIRQVHIKEGQVVRVGDLLFTLDMSMEQANLAKARAQLARDLADLADAKRQYQRSVELLAQHFISQSATDTALSKVENLQAAVDADRAAITGGQVSVRYGTIRAPISGRTGAINVYPGSLVQPTGTSFVSIAQINPIYIAFSLPERELAGLQNITGAMVEAQFAGQVDKQMGKIVFVDNAVDAQSVVPTQAVQSNAEQQFVYLAQNSLAQNSPAQKSAAVKMQKTAEQATDKSRENKKINGTYTVRTVPIRVLYSEKKFAVIEGVDQLLSVGELVVAEGAQNIRPGSLVKQAEQPAEKSNKSSEESSKKTTEKPNVALNNNKPEVAKVNVFNTDRSTADGLNGTKKLKQFDLWNSD